MGTDLLHQEGHLATLVMSDRQILHIHPPTSRQKKDEGETVGQWIADHTQTPGLDPQSTTGTFPIQDSS